ncbi:hypothetical protein O181_005053 [Austropuccinia psidii MF-1]|uniref:Uncharacterized protein n=1 Tax=Austropuccinia psidii MF-1 TaxID=1389203 RepID=A0A9Q3GF60_9BASI|nr:hypothetical protein [Austropuccinia psidii MF-1]
MHIYIAFFWFEVKGRGLKALSLRLVNLENQHAKNSFRGLKLALSRTLTTFSLHFDLPLKDAELISFLQATPLIKSLSIGRLAPSSRIFGILSLENLTCLVVKIFRPADEGDETGWEGFCENLTQFVKQSLVLETLELDFFQHPILSVDLLLEVFVGSINSGEAKIRCLRRLTVRSVAAPTIVKFERLCQALPELERLAIQIPNEDSVSI